MRARINPVPRAAGSLLINLRLSPLYSRCTAVYPVHRLYYTFHC
jgi:hypothetical protein